MSCLQAQNSKNTEITASGKVVTKDINVQSFDQLDVSGVFSVHLLQGSNEGVKIESDENFQSLFEVRNEGSKLVISMKKNVNVKGKMKTNLYITFKKLKSMELKTVGDVSCDQNLSFDDLQIDNKSVGSVNLKLTAGKINVNNKGVGDVNFDGKAETAVIRNNGVGSINAANFAVQKMDIENTGVGAAEVNASQELKVKDSFLGKVKNRGAASARKMNKVVI
jgi:hypothetical protein